MTARSNDGDLFERSHKTFTCMFIIMNTWGGNATGGNKADIDSQSATSLK